MSDNRTQIIDILKRFSRADISQGQAADGISHITEEEIVLRERSRCIALCSGWIDSFKDREIKYVAPREYAIDAINDIMDLISDGQEISMPAARSKS